MFKELSINQLIKIFRNTSYIKAFCFSIESLQRSSTVFSFYDCITRLLNMRNKLAHEMENLQFKDQDLIELLTHEQILQEQITILQNYDIHKMDAVTLYIASNIVFLRKLTAELDNETICVQAK